MRRRLSAYLEDRLILLSVRRDPEDQSVSKVTAKGPKPARVPMTRLSNRPGVGVPDLGSTGKIPLSDSPFEESLHVQADKRAW